MFSIAALVIVNAIAIKYLLTKASRLEIRVKNLENILTGGSNAKATV